MRRQDKLQCPDELESAGASRVGHHDQESTDACPRAQVVDPEESEATFHFHFKFLEVWSLTSKQEAASRWPHVSERMGNWNTYLTDQPGWPNQRKMSLLGLEPYLSIVVRTQTGLLLGPPQQSLVHGFVFAMLQGHGNHQHRGSHNLLQNCTNVLHYEFRGQRKSWKAWGNFRNS